MEHDLLEQENTELQREIESLRAELADKDQSWKRVVANNERQWDEAWHGSQSKIIDLSRERDEARQECAELKYGATFWRDYAEGLEIKLEKEQQANAALLEKVRGLPTEIMRIDAFADVEELTFPLTDPTDERQVEWFEEFLDRMNDHAEGVVRELLEEYDTAQPTAKGEPLSPQKGETNG